MRSCATPRRFAAFRTPLDGRSALGKQSAQIFTDGRLICTVMLIYFVQRVVVGTSIGMSLGRSRGIAAEIGFFRDGEGDARHGDAATVSNTKRSRKRSRSLRQKGIYKANKDLRSSAVSVPEAKNERADGPSHVTSGSDVEPNIFTSTYFRDIPIVN